MSENENVVETPKQPRNNDEVFVLCYQRNAGNVQETAKELKVKENTVKMRALKYIAAGVNLCPPQKKSRSLKDRVAALNSLLT